MQDHVARFLTVLGSERGFSTNTISAYRNDLTQFVEYLRQPPEQDHQVAVGGWGELTDSHLQSFLLSMREREYAASTVARKIAAIKSFCGYLVSEGILRSDPSERMAAPRVHRDAPRALSADEITTLLAQPLKNSGGSPKPEALRDQVMLETLYATGMRVSELVALNLRDVNPSDRSVQCPGKSGRARAVSLKDETVSLLATYIEDARPNLTVSENPALFLNHRGSRLTRQGFWLILKSYAENAGLPDVTPHTLRHTYAAHALKNGADLRDIQRQLGHVSVATTQIYKQLASQPPATTSAATMGNGSANGHVGDPGHVEDASSDATSHFAGVATTRPGATEADFAQPLSHLAKSGA